MSKAGQFIVTVNDQYTGAFSGTLSFINTRDTVLSLHKDIATLLQGYLNTFIDTGGGVPTGSDKKPLAPMFTLLSTIQEAEEVSTSHFITTAKDSKVINEKDKYLCVQIYNGTRL